MRKSTSENLKFLQQDRFFCRKSPKEAHQTSISTPSPQGEQKTNIRNEKASKVCNQSLTGKKNEEPDNKLSILMSLQISVQFFEKESEKLEKREKQLEYMIQKRQESLAKTQQKAREQCAQLKNQLSDYWKYKQIYIKQKIQKQQQWLDMHQNPFHILQHHIQSHFLPHLCSQFYTKISQQSSTINSSEHASSPTIRFIHSRKNQSSQSSSSYERSIIIGGEKSLENSFHLEKGDVPDGEKISLKEQLRKISKQNEKKNYLIRSSFREKKREDNQFFQPSEEKQGKALSMRKKVEQSVKKEKESLKKRKHISLGHILIKELPSSQKQILPSSFKNRMASKVLKNQSPKKKPYQAKKAEFSLPLISPKRR